MEQNKGVLRDKSAFFGNCNDSGKGKEGES